MPLPNREIGVAYRQARQRRFAALAKAVVQLGKFVEQNIQRPFVGDDVVQHPDQNMALARQLKQRHPHQRPVNQIERLALQFFDLAFNQLISVAGLNGKIQAPDFYRAIAADDLHRFSAFVCKNGAQAFVPDHQFIDTALHCVGVNFTVQIHRIGDVVGTAIRLELRQKPQPLLTVRQRQRRIAADAGNRELPYVDAAFFQKQDQCLALFRTQGM